MPSIQAAHCAPVSGCQHSPEARHAVEHARRQRPDLRTPVAEIQRASLLGAGAGAQQLVALAVSQGTAAELHLPGTDGGEAGEGEEQRCHASLLGCPPAPLARFPARGEEEAGRTGKRRVRWKGSGWAEGFDEVKLWRGEREHAPDEASGNARPAADERHAKTLSGRGDSGQHEVEQSTGAQTRSHRRYIPGESSEQHQRMHASGEGRGPAVEARGGGGLCWSPLSIAIRTGLVTSVMVSDRITALLADKIVVQICVLVPA
jgi:hypothetical protein